MSDELERRLREAGHRLPEPEPGATLHARARFLEAAPRPRRRAIPRRGLVLALAAAAVAAGAFGVGYAVASGGSPKTRVVVHTVKARLNAGPGFLPSEGWTTTASKGAATATSAGIRIEAQFFPASRKPGLPQRLLPLRLPSGGRVRSLLVHIGSYAVQVKVTFASAQPDAATLAAAREELGRLVVPSCPAAVALTKADVPAAKAYVLRWLPAHYDGDRAETEGATATARLGWAMPRHGESVADCGLEVAARSVEVDVTLPRLATVSASLSELTYFVARTTAGWVVWERAR